MNDFSAYHVIGVYACDHCMYVDSSATTDYGLCGTICLCSTLSTTVYKCTGDYHTDRYHTADNKCTYCSIQGH